MPKQNARPKPPHRPASRKSKPKFDVPDTVGEASAAGWVYRDEAVGAGAELVASVSAMAPAAGRAAAATEPVEGVTATELKAEASAMAPAAGRAAAATEPVEGVTATELQAEVSTMAPAAGRAAAAANPGVQVEGGATELQAEVSTMAPAAGRAAAATERGAQVEGAAAELGAEASAMAPAADRGAAATERGVQVEGGAGAELGAEAPDAAVDQRAKPAAALVVETITAPIAGAIRAAAAIEPDPRVEEFGRSSEVYDESDFPTVPPVSLARGIFDLGFGVVQFVASTTWRMATFPLGIARRTFRGK